MSCVFLSLALVWFIGYLWYGIIGAIRTARDAETRTLWLMPAVLMLAWPLFVYWEFRDWVASKKDEP